jgi:hypothetical protein
MKSQPKEEVEGSLYGSYRCLYLSLVVPLLALAVLLGIANTWSWAPTVAIPFAVLFLPWYVQRMMTVTVTEAGVRLRQSGIFNRVSVAIPWENIEKVRFGHFSTSLVLKEPQKLGSRSTRRFMFIGLDPHWARRTTTLAVISRIVPDVGG